MESFQSTRQTIYIYIYIVWDVILNIVIKQVRCKIQAKEDKINIRELLRLYLFFRCISLLPLRQFNTNRQIKLVCFSCILFKEPWKRFQFTLLETILLFNELTAFQLTYPLAIFWICMDFFPLERSQRKCLEIFR